ncbi:MAG TPA: histidine kinase dimerization/phosphoacceptor domain-containing protein [Burkholderiaceae bacterium]
MRMKDSRESCIAERDRTTRELHDSLLQDFHGLMLHFQIAADRIPADSPARTLMEAALNRADAVLTESRHRLLELDTSGRFASAQAVPSATDASSTPKARPPT